MFRRILVANRGEIAARIIRTCRRLGIETVAVHSDADSGAPHVRLADQSVRLGPAPVKDSYLNMDALLGAIRDTGAEAVHPGYGLLSENAVFAGETRKQGTVFIGPPNAALDAFGDKIKARAVARSVGVSPPPGTDGALDPGDAAAFREAAERIGLPVLLKAAGGGGGIGMQLVRDLADLERAARTCSDRGKASFGDPRVYMEKYVEGPRHIEVQVFRDTHGNAVALGERECSVQRRHQKIIEESPSPASFFSGPEGEARRKRLHEDALRVVEAAHYEGAGTVEFVASSSGELYFLEVNARLQVEHPVTEMVTGLDLVELQLRIAAGEPLPRRALESSRCGHAVEARVYAEDPSKGFVPQPGKVERLVWPEESRGFLRIDAGIEEGGEVTSFYDPMIAKVIAAGKDRAEAIARLSEALARTELRLAGPKGPRATNIEFLRTVLESERFASGDYDTALAERLAKGN